ncbi:MAG: RNA polymerase factor sigma-32 [Rickettsiales bacterium]|nr:RNA polymerase factor sigma-32 [Rickettsiales bacterium]
MLVALEQQNSLNKYLSEVYKIPVLTEEEEKRYALLKEQGDLNAAKILISSHLRLVVKIAFTYKRYGLPMMDVISEGNIGLMRAVKEFTLSKGCKLATYAMWWIRATIQDFILKSWSLVKIGTTVAQKKLFFNLSKIKDKIFSYDQKELTNDNIKYISQQLNVPEYEVISMDKRLSKQDISLNRASNRIDDDNKEIIELLPSKYGTPESILMARDSGNKKQLLIQNAIKMLNDREKDILYNRRLIENPLTLKELSEKYQISGERIRQIEEGALKKIKDFITNNGYENGWR